MIDQFLPALPLATWAATAAITAIVSAVVGTGVSVYGQQQAAKAQENAAAANAKHLRDTAAVREQEAQEAVKRQHREARAQLAALRATLAGTGTQLNDGSNLDILGASTTRLETRVNDYARQSTMEASQLRDAAAQSLWQGSQASAAAGLASLGTVLEGTADVAASYSRSKQTGAL